MTADFQTPRATSQAADRRTGRVEPVSPNHAGQLPMRPIKAPETSAVYSGSAEAQLRPEGSGAPRAGHRSTRQTPPNIRIGGQQLLHLRDRLSDRDRSLLASLADHPFLTTQQLARLHFTDHASDASSGRVARRVLARLSEVRAIEHLERRIGGVRAGSASFVWRLGPIGERLLDGDPDKPRARRKQPTLHHLDHTLAIAEAHIRLLEASREHQIDLLRVETEPHSWRHFVGPSAAAAVLKPDLYAVTAAGDFEDHWFIEVDRGTESLPTLLHKCGQYEGYRRSGQEQRSSGVFPWVLWLLPTAGAAERLSRAIAAHRSLDAGLFRASSFDELLAAVRGASS